MDEAVINTLLFMILIEFIFTNRWLTIEELITELKKKFTVVIVTHNMQQAARIADMTAFFHLGDLIEYDETEKIFINPVEKKTEDYITGRFG